MFVVRWLKPFTFLILFAYAGATFVLLQDSWSGVRHWLELTVFLSMLFGIAFTWAGQRRERWVREQPLPQFLKRKVRQAYPHLSGKDLELVERGLRQFFLSCLRGKKKFVAMPSRVVDAMWHEFILHTKAYKDWCSLGLGWFLHHTPAEALGKKARNNDGLRRAWYWSCKDEGINPYAPTRLPLLFALDAKLEIANGFTYAPDCSDIDQKNAKGGDDAGGIYCGTDFSDDSYVGDSVSLGGSEIQRNGSDSSDDGTILDDVLDGISGDGCSGGGCGGGD